jgi:RimJ/RimL family protein N-acetyltransferase
MRDDVVVLGPFVASDAPVLCEADADPEHRRRFDFPEGFIPSLRHSEEVIARWDRERRAGERFTFAVRDSSTGELLAGCELRPLGDGAANVSYWTYPRHRRRGIATRAAALLCEAALRQFGFGRLEITADVDNTASRRIATRLGFREAGTREVRILYLRP